MNPKPPRLPIARRKFVEILAASGAVGLVHAEHVAEAQDAKSDKKSDPIEAEVDARMALIVARYGARLDDEAREQVREDVRQLIRRGQRLKRLSMSNGDGPFPALVPYRSHID